MWCMQISIKIKWYYKHLLLLMQLQVYIYFVLLVESDDAELKDLQKALVAMKVWLI